MQTHRSSRSPPLLLASAAYADTLINNVNGIQVGADGKLQHFTGLLIGDDGKVRQLLEQPDDVARPTSQHRRSTAGPHAAARPDRRAWPCHRPRFRRAAPRRHRHELDRRACSSGCATMRPRIPTRDGSSGCGWNQEMLARQALPDRSRPRRRRARPAGGAGAGRRPCGRRQQRGDEGRGRHRRRPPAPRAARSDDGVFVDAARGLIDKAIPADTGASSDQALAKAQDILLGYGVTGVGSMSTSMADWQAFRRAGEAGTAATSG